MRTIAYYLGLLLVSTATLAGPGQLSGIADTAIVFSAADFYRIILDHHPIVRQAALLNSEAQQDVLQARGAFDPKLFSVYDRKEFGQSLYYDKWQSGLTVPVLPGGVDVKVTYDRNMGQYINPEERVPSSGLAAVGLRVPIGQGLLIDARRTTLRQAQLALTLADAERLKLINKTLYEAAKTYWEWYLAHRQYHLIKEGQQVATTRFEAVQQRALLGDAAAIDTTEALITAQDRFVQLQQANVDLQNARLRLAAFLWHSPDAGSAPQPIDMPSTVAPQAAPVHEINEAVLQNLLG